MRVETEPSPVGQITELGFFDAHVHLNDVGMARAVMDEYGVDRAVVFWGRDSSNASLLDAAKSHPGRFAPFVSFSPERDAYRTYWDNEDLALLDDLDEALESGAFVGIGELSVSHFARGGFPEAYSIYETNADVKPRWLALIEERPTRFVVGTDAALHDIDRARAKVGGVQRLLEQLTPSTRALVASGNLTRILSERELKKAAKASE